MRYPHLGVDPGEPDEHLCLSDDLVGPLLLIEVGSVAMTDGMGGDLVAVGVQVLDLGVVRPLVGHVESTLKDMRKVSKLQRLIQFSL